MADTYRATLSVQDRALKDSHTGVWVSNADAAAFLTAQSTGANTGNVNTLLNAVHALQLGGEVSRKIEGVSTDTAGTPSTANDDLRQNKIAVTLKDTTTGRISTLTIPTRDSTKYTLSNQTGLIIITGTGVSSQVSALVTALQTTALSSEGNGVSVVQMKPVGRAVSS